MGNIRGSNSTAEEQKIDRRVGALIRERRLALGISQEKLAAECDITFQQVQKYEHGHNRLSISRGFILAKALGMTLPEFLSGIDNTKPAPKTLPKDRSKLELFKRIPAMSGKQAKATIAFINASAHI